MKLSPDIEALLPEAVRLRRELHRIPELGFQLFETQKFVWQTLQGRPSPPPALPSRRQHPGPLRRPGLLRDAGAGLRELYT